MTYYEVTQSLALSDSQQRSRCKPSGLDKFFSLILQRRRSNRIQSRIKISFPRSTFNFSVTQREKFPVALSSAGSHFQQKGFMIMLQHPNVFYGLSFLSCSRETSSRVSSYQVPREKSHLAEGYVYFIEGLVPEKRRRRRNAGQTEKLEPFEEEP